MPKFRRVTVVTAAKRATWYKRRQLFCEYIREEIGCYLYCLKIIMYSGTRVSMAVSTRQAGSSGPFNLTPVDLSPEVRFRSDNGLAGAKLKLQQTRQGEK